MALAVITAAALAWFFSIARSALPEIDGTLAVRGLSAPVSITRDSHGVPTIEAATLDDLFFAQGYVTAQDRLFQMDLMRRAAAGELSEVVGDVALRHDRQQRIEHQRDDCRGHANTANAEGREVRYSHR